MKREDLDQVVTLIPLATALVQALLKLVQSAREDGHDISADELEAANDALRKLPDLGK
jgi:hypothetical protein